MPGTRTNERQGMGAGNASGTRTGPTTQAAGPGLTAARNVRGTDAAAANSIVAIIRQHPRERDAILRWAQQARGNAFVTACTSRLGRIETLMPNDYAFEAVSGSVWLPGGRELAGDWSHDVRTTRDTKVTVTIRNDGITVGLSPPMYIDATWPLQNAVVRGAHYAFGSGAADVYADDVGGLGEGMFSVTDRIESSINSKIMTAVRGTPLARRGYRLVSDPTLETTVNSLLASIQGMASGGGGGGRGGGVSRRDLQGVEISASVRPLRPDAAGRTIDLGSGPMTVTVRGNGSVDAIARARDRQGQADAANISEVRLDTTDLKVMSGGQPLAQINSLSMARGGRVTVNSFTPLGRLARAQRTESGVSGLVALLALATRSNEGMQIANAAQRNANDPRIVDGIARAEIERRVEQELRDLIMANRHAVPGVDLARALGMQIP